MAVGLDKFAQLLPVAGIQLGIAQAGIKRADNDDLVLISYDQSSCVSAVFTRNVFCAAPVVVAREHCKLGRTRAILINTGNANAGTGERGLVDCRSSCVAVAEQLGVEPEQILPFSTGVIGEHLPIEKILSAAPELVASLGSAEWEQVARGIMTTDTVPKGACCQFEVSGKKATISGIAKGAGMIRPDMATMLSFVTTDLPISQSLLDQALSQAIGVTFNSVTVDGDTSTNDACVLVATHQLDVAEVDDQHSIEYQQFCTALNQVCLELAQALVRDGEGATKFIEIAVSGAMTVADAREVAFTIAHSPLVKTAFFASDPNWGRLLAAIGRAKVDGLVIESIGLDLNDVQVIECGTVAASYTEAAGAEVMAKEEICIAIDLGQGNQQATVWTCDFSYDYVRINAEYRT